VSDPIEIIARHVATARYGDLPASAIAAIKTFVLDSLGVCIAGTAAPYADCVREAAARWGSGDEATALGARTRLPAASAALVNAYQTHCQEFDCIHEAAVVHPMATVLSAALAVAERQGQVSGRELMLAIALGVDTSTTIGMAARANLKFFRPATAGIFGATAAAGRLIGLDEPALINAFGIALGQAAGTMQAHVEGKASLPLQVAMAARAAVNAVDLAGAGFPGPHNVLEGPYGYYPLFEGVWELGPAVVELGRVWRVTELSHKPFPTGRANHAGIEGIQQLMSRHGIAADAVARVVLEAPPLIQQLVGRPYKSGMDVAYARLCFPYVAAVVLSRGSVGLDDFTPERRADAKLAALAAGIEVVRDGNPNANALAPQSVHIELKTGARHAFAVPHTLGSPEHPLDRAAHLAKFRGCWGYGGADAAKGEKLIALVDRLEQLGDVAELVQLTIAA
jgi:aconitate decarboxylase